MDLSENGKCLFTSLQYVESSHAPYQRIRFFILTLFMNLISTNIIEKTIVKYVLLTLKPKISQRSEAFCRRNFTFLGPTNVQITIYPR
jgi:hypothetical protein